MAFSAAATTMAGGKASAQAVTSTADPKDGRDGAGGAGAAGGRGRDGEGAGILKREVGRRAGERRPQEAKRAHHDPEQQQQPQRPKAGGGKACTGSRKPALTRFGSRERGMCLIPPPSPSTTTTDTTSSSSTSCSSSSSSRPSSSSSSSPPPGSHMVPLLSKLDGVLKKPSVKRRLAQRLRAGDSSLRLIQAGRYEIFVQARNKASDAFDSLVEGGNRFPEGFKSALLRFATEQARRDPRLQNGRYSFGNFSLIVNYDPVQPQAPHIDLLWPNFQFGLAVTDNIPGTLFREVGAHVATVDDLLATWRAQGWGEPPSALTAAMRKESRLRDLVREYGDVLAPPHSCSPRPSPSSAREKEEAGGMIGSAVPIRAGTLLSLPGSVVHAGPRSSGFRAVMFFSAWPEGSDVAEYDPDTQYSSVLLCGHLVSLMWAQIGVGFSERLYLLRVLAGEIESCPVKDLWLHFSEGEFAKFIKCIERGTFSKKRGDTRGDSRAAYIEKSARNAGLCTSSIPFGLGPVGIDQKNLVRVSVKGLEAEWGRRYHQVVVYRDQSGRIYLRYPSLTPGQKRKIESWEGLDDGENYRLEFKANGRKGRMFDGENGTLFDSEGQKIKCRSKKRARKVAKKPGSDRKTKNGRRTRVTTREHREVETAKAAETQKVAFTITMEPIQNPPPKLEKSRRKNKKDIRLEVIWDESTWKKHMEVYRARQEKERIIKQRRSPEKKIVASSGSQ